MPGWEGAHAWEGALTPGGGGRTPGEEGAHTWEGGAHAKLERRARLGRGRIRMVGRVRTLGGGARTPRRGGTLLERGAYTPREACT
jgi:hypothetical protein